MKSQYKVQRLPAIANTSSSVWEKGAKGRTEIRWDNAVIVSGTRYVFILFYFYHFYFPAQLVGGFNLSDLLDKPWSQVSSLLPPGRAFVFIAHRVQHSHHYILRIHQALQSTPYIVHKDTIAINQTPHCNLTHRHPSKDSSTAGIISLYVRRSNIVVYSEH